MCIVPASKSETREQCTGEPAKKSEIGTASCGDLACWVQISYAGVPETGLVIWLRLWGFEQRNQLHGSSLCTLRALVKLSIIVDDAQTSSTEIGGLNGLTAT
jgi:hypothetical protein